jgi:hypothetical protein
LKTRNATSKQRKIAQSFWSKLRTDLEQEKADIYEQIGHYPTPIAACDQQFNYLLHKHRKVLQALAALNEAEQESLTAADPLKVVAEYMRSSTSQEATIE